MEIKKNRRGGEESEMKMIDNEKVRKDKSESIERGEKRNLVDVNSINKRSK